MKTCKELKAYVGPRERSVLPAISATATQQFPQSQSRR